MHWVLPRPPSTAQRASHAGKHIHESRAGLPGKSCKALSRSNPQIALRGESKALNNPYQPLLSLRSTVDTMYATLYCKIGIAWLALDAAVPQRCHERLWLTLSLEAAVLLILLGDGMP